MILAPWFSYDDAGNQRSDSFKSHQSLVKRWCDTVYDECRSEYDRNEEIASIEKYIRYLMGHHWPKKRPSYKSSPVDNRIWSNLVMLVSFLTDIRQSFEVKANAKELDKTAEKINKLARSWFVGQDIDMTTAMVIIYSALTVGYARQVYNQDLNGGEGDLELTACGPLDVIPIKPTATLQGAYGLIYEKALPLSWFPEHYPLLGDLVPADDQYSRYRGRETSNNSQTWFLGPAFRQLFHMNEQQTIESAIPMGRYREFWLKDNSRNTSNNVVYVGDMAKKVGYAVSPGGKLYPRGRLIVMGGPVVLHDGPNPFWHGRFPFAAMRINQVPWMWPGVSEFRNQLPMQDTTNSIIAGVLDLVKKAVNPPMYAPMNAFSESIRKSMDPNIPNAKYFYNQQAGQPPMWQQIPQLPSFVMDMLGYAREAQTAQTGFVDSGAISSKKIIPSDDTLERLSQGQQTLVRLKVRYIETFFREIGEQYVANVFQFLGARRVHSSGLDGLLWSDFQWSQEDISPHGINPETAWRSFRWHVNPGSLLKSSRAEDKVTAMNFRRNGDMDRKTLYKVFDMEAMTDDVETNLEKEGAQILINVLRQKMSGAGGGGGLSPDVLNQLNNATKEAPLPIN